ncbi:MAG: efflux RND transporter permease subunit [Terriglobia bacterium]
MAHKTDSDIIATTHNTARFFTEYRQISWVLLFGTLLWGVYGYIKMPQRKDPDIPVRVAVAICPWPGAGAEKIEQLVTRKVEEKMAENSKVKKIESISRGSVSIVYVELDERVDDTGKEFDDIKGKLDGIRDLPQGAGPVNFIKDFGDTAALMLTVASPKVSEVEIAVRAQAIQQVLERVRRRKPSLGAGSPFSIVVGCPHSISAESIRRHMDAAAEQATRDDFAHDVQIVEGPGFVVLDGVTRSDDASIMRYTEHFIQEHLHASEFHPDAWLPVIIRDPRESAAKLASVAGDQYSYRELDDFTDLIQRTIQTVPQASKVSRSGLLDETVYLEYSQERLASYGVLPATLVQVLSGRNITLRGGLLEVENKNLSIDPSGEFKSEKEIGDVLIGTSSTGTPVYLRDLVETSRSYQSPPRFLNFFTWRDGAGKWQRTRAVTLAVQMRPGEQIGKFGTEIDKALANLSARLPRDLIIARTSDQPMQVKEAIDLFMRSLYEAVVLVVVVALIGFWEWRSAVLLALSIPLTLAMTYGMMHLLGIDLQQVSIASLIIALGLLVDDPVVAGDAIKRDLARGHPPVVAAWLGPTKLATVIMFATVTNIVAYLPFLALPGDTGRFIYTLPIVLTCSLIASRLVSMTFIPLLGYYLLRPGRTPDRPMEDRRDSGFTGVYFRLGRRALQHRWLAFAASLVFVAAGLFFVRSLKESFFPKDLSYLSYVDIWLPEDVPLFATNQAARRAEAIIRRVADEYGKGFPDEKGQPRAVLKSLTTFLGGGGPRFWFSVSPEQQQLNYAQIIIHVQDKHDTNHLVGPLQQALSAGVPGARVDVRQLENGPPVGIPVSIRISGEDIPTLRALGEQAKSIFRAVPDADRVRDDWGAENFVVKLQVDPDRANLAGFSNLDVASSSVSGMYGSQVTTLREGNKEIPVLMRLRMDERAQLSDIQSLYVHSPERPQKVPLGQISSIAYGMETQKLQRRNQFRTITVSAFPVPGTLPSEVLNAARTRLTDFEKALPPGYKMQIGGEEEKQKESFFNIAVVMLISVVAIFLSLVIQFRNAVKPLIVYAAIPYGMVGALIALRIMDAPFGFMAFLGIASLVGVIVSHVIVLFDFIEEAHERGEPLEQALLDAGIVRLRPVMITVGATILGLFPLAMHGGPLWEPLCYAQIGGLAVATFVTLLMVPVIYSICVLDLKIVKWEPMNSRAGPGN